MGTDVNAEKGAYEKGGALDTQAFFSYTSSYKKAFLSIVVCQFTQVKKWWISFTRRCARGKRYGKKEGDDSPFQCRPGEIKIVVQDGHTFFTCHLYLTDPLSKGQRQREEPVTCSCGGLMD